MYSITFLFRTVTSIITSDWLMQWDWAWITMTTEAAVRMKRRKIRCFTCPGVRNIWIRNFRRQELSCLDILSGEGLRSVFLFSRKSIWLKVKVMPMVYFSSNTGHWLSYHKGTCKKVQLSRPSVSCLLPFKNYLSFV